MDINIDALNWITNYDLTNRFTLDKHNIKTVTIVSDHNNVLLPKLFILKYDGKEESYIIDYEPYYQHLRLKKIQKIINKFGIK